MRTFNIQQTYVEKNNPWAGILVAAAFENFSTTNSQKGYCPGQLIFGRDIILPIKHRVGWELLRQQKQMQMIRDNTRKNRHRVEHEYKAGDNVILTKHTT